MAKLSQIFKLLILHFTKFYFSQKSLQIE